MSSTNLFIALSFLAGLLCSDATDAVAQQSAAQEIQIDCSAFQKDRDGSWVASRSTTLKIGTNSLTISGKNSGSVNGLSIQTAISQKCEQAASGSKPAAGSPPPNYANTNWIAKPQTVDACVARGREVVQNLSPALVAGESVFAWADGYTFVIRCTPKNMVLFALVGPPNSTTERNHAAQAIQDKMLDNW
jgi:hypothetical protein